MQQQLPTIEGLTPTIVWYTLVGIVGVMALIVLYGKVESFFVERKARKSNEKAKEDGTIQGQLDTINRKLDSIDDFIRETNTRFDRDNRRINTLETDTDRIAKGINALARAELAHLQHDITGNHTDNLGLAEREITDYLTQK